MSSSVYGNKVRFSILGCILISFCAIDAKQILRETVFFKQNQKSSVTKGARAQERINLSVPGMMFLK